MTCIIEHKNIILQSKSDVLLQKSNPIIYFIIMKNDSKLSRRSFLKCSAVGALGSAVSVPTILTSCSSEGSKAKGPIIDVEVLEFIDKAPAGKTLKAGLIGCGGRGTGAAINFLEAADDVHIVALGDVFDDKLQACREQLKKEKGIEIADANCFTGFDSYKQVIDLDLDVVLLCAPPYFRPQHFEYAVEKGRHCFLEKPCAVDPVGARQMMITSKRAEAKRLSVINGTVRRNQKDVNATLQQVKNGAIGQIVSGHTVRHGGSLWTKARQPGWSDMEYMLRNWPNFTWLSADMITENFIHEVDLLNLFMGDKRPEKCSAVGGRARRKTGDVYDYFSMEFTYEGGIRAACTSRQIDGCDNEHRVTVYGTEGYTDCFCTIYNLDGTVKWEYQYPDGQKGDGWKGLGEGYVLEHVRLISAIRTDKPVNDTDKHVQSTLMTIMAREAGYTGKILKYDEFRDSALKLGPEVLAMGPVNPPIPEEIKLPGKESTK